jgi:dipeptidyl-peptidase 4
MKNIILVIVLITLCSNLIFAQTISLEDIFVKNKFRSESVAGFNSMKDGKHYTMINDAKELVKVGFKDGKQKAIICNLATFTFQGRKIEIDDYQFNENETKILLFTESENIYRRSILNKVFVYDVQSKSLDIVQDKKVLHASFSPSSNEIAYVLDNNLYIYNLSDKSTFQITEDGKQNEIINGNCDWVYEEEFEFSKAYEWSSTGNELAFYKFNEKVVPEFSFSKYGNLYPQEYKYKYPKAGEQNSTVGIYTYNLANKQTKKVDIGSENDIYIPRIKYNDFDNSLVVYKLNRLQNKLTMFRLKQNQTESELIYNEDNDKYLEVNDNIIFLKEQNLFFYTSERSGYTHIWVHDIDNNTDAPITNGNWEVTIINGVDEKSKTIYYTSTEINATDRNVFKITFDGKIKKNITPEVGTHNIEFSNGLNYFMDTYSKLNTPAQYTIRDNNGKIIRILNENAKLAATINEASISKVEFIKVPNLIGDSLNAWIIKPKNINDGAKHPLLMFQYSGPGSQQVLNSFTRDFWWYQHLAQQGYVIACVDGRGTGARGEAFKKCTYLQLGKLESDDQIAAAKYFGTLPFIDKTRIGIWGWSYGGFMSSICICKGADVFKSAIAVAPVTNWRYYDNVYTERYMRKPQENATGYDENSPINMVKQLKGNYLLIHGSGDDNVHYQNSMEMINALIKADKEFDSEVYPNRAHGISGANTRFHLYKRLTKFIVEKL